MHETAPFPLVEDKEKLDVLIVDSGMRGRAIKWAFEQSSQAGAIETVPFDSGRPMDSVRMIGRYAAEKSFDAVMVGQENAQDAGIVNHLRARGIPTCGATAEEAQLESHKSLFKEKAEEFEIPTARCKVFGAAHQSRRRAHDYIDELGEIGVIKDDYLAEGKGVHVFTSNQDGHDALNAMYAGGFNNKGAKVLIEEYLAEREKSKHYSVSRGVIDIWPDSEDHKQVEPEDKGLMGGGSGVVAPLDWREPNHNDEDDLRDALLFAELAPDLRGFMFPGKKGKYLELNMRLGSPEIEAYVRLMESDFLRHVVAIINGTLDEHRLEWKEGYAVSIVGMAEGYPDSDAIANGQAITGLEAAEAVDNVVIFPGAVHLGDGGWKTAGGRLFDVTAYGETLASARHQALLAMSHIQVGGRPARHRWDIGVRAA